MSNIFIPHLTYNDPSSWLPDAKQGLAPAYTPPVGKTWQEHFLLPNNYPVFTWNTQLRSGLSSESNYVIPTLAWPWYQNSKLDLYRLDLLPSTYNGPLILLNEPDLKSKARADLGEGELATLPDSSLGAMAMIFVIARRKLPQARLLSPAWSPKIFNNKVEVSIHARFLKALSQVRNTFGINLQVSGHTLHLYAGYPSNTGRRVYPKEMIDNFYESLPEIEQKKPLFIHETGIRNALIDTGYDPDRWWEEIDKHPKVVAYGLFAWKEPESEAPVLPDGTLTKAGESYRRRAVRNRT